MDESLIDEVRALLARTGVQRTHDDEDPGHISNCWRREIEQLIDFVDAGLLGLESRDGLALLRQSQRSAEYERARADELRDAIARARAVVQEAEPRMRSLNNAMTPGWLARAAEFLED